MISVTVGARVHVLREGAHQPLPATVLGVGDGELRLGPDGDDGTPFSVGDVVTLALGDDRTTGAVVMSLDGADVVVGDVASSPRRQRRLHRRVPVAFTVRYRLVPDGDERVADAVDLSVAGICLVVAEAAAQASSLSLRLTGPFDEVACPGRVVAVRPSSRRPGAHDLHIAFTSVSPVASEALVSLVELHDARARSR